MAQLDRWQIGSGDLVLSQGARGSDLMVAEAALAKGAEVEVLLAKPVEQFIQSSVILPGTDWSDRFQSVLARSRVLVQADEIGPASAGENLYTRNNRWTLDRAMAAAGNDALVLVVDSGQEPREGGTADFAEQATERGLAVTRIDPSRAFRYDQARSTLREARDDGPKRLLALDGGGMRGLISLQFLRRMAELIGNGDKQYRLCSTFDYFAGTSTGAMIAACLACGSSVDDVENLYRSLGRRIFTKRWLPGRLRSFYKAGGITAGLKDFFGTDTTLGDPSLQSLLAIVTHRTDTDSIWPITNVSTARYNDRARGDCNLDFPLWQILRGSTAAPVFFPPEQIRLGPSGPPALFEDGGVTPFNNPAPLLVELATSPRYTLDWPTGPDELLVVSVGTGSSITASSTDVKKLGLMFQARTLIRVIMNGSSTENDRLCQVLGDTRHAPRIDSEFNDESVNAIQPHSPLFSYVRYNVAIGSKDLAQVPELSDINAKKVGRLDAANLSDMEQLIRIGRYAANQVQLAHFAGFLP